MSWLSDTLGNVSDAVGDAWSSFTGETASDTATEAMQEATQQGIDWQREMWNTTRADQAPFRGAAVNALGRMEDRTMPGFDFGEFTASPDYQFRLGEGTNALLSNASALGKRLSGNTMKALTDYGQNLAGEEYGKWYDRRAGERDWMTGREDEGWRRDATLAGLLPDTSSANSNAANAITQLMQGAGQANAANALQSYQGQQGALQTIMQAYGLFK